MAHRHSHSRVFTGCMVLQLVFLSCTPMMQPIETEPTKAMLKFALVEGSHGRSSPSQSAGGVISPAAPRSWMDFVRSMIEKETAFRAEVIIPQVIDYGDYDSSVPVGFPISLQDERLSGLPVIVIYFQTLQGDDWARLAEYVRNGGFFIGISDDSGNLSGVKEGFQVYGGLQGGVDLLIQSLPDGHPVYGGPFDLAEVLPLSGLDVGEYSGLISYTIRGRLSGVSFKSRQLVEMFNTVQDWSGGFKASPLANPRCQMLANVMIYAMQQKGLVAPR